MNELSRRRFLSMVGSGAAGLTLAPLMTLHAQRSVAAPSSGAGFGPLEEKLPLNTGELINDVIGDLRNTPILALPQGFEYTVVSATGDLMSDGNLVPGAHDGMGAFRGRRGSMILVRNHELNVSNISVAVANGAKYDSGKSGGNTTLTIDNQGRLDRHYGSLAGTERNCAGGPTPWNS